MDLLDKEGFVMSNNVDINADNNWDDSAIVNVFEDAVRKHRTKNDQLNGGSVRDSRLQAVSASKSPSEASNAANGKRKKARFNSSNMESVAKEVQERSSGPVSTNDSFSSILKAYSKSPNSNSSSSNSFTVSEAGAHFTVYDQTNLNTAANATSGLASESSEWTKQSENYGNVPSSSSTPFKSPISVAEGSVSASIETALNDMLMAWYHSGYATGRYQTLLEVQQQQQQCKDIPDV